MNDLINLLPIAVLLLFAYLLLIRPARKRQQEASKLQASLAVGSEVMLTSGIFATVVLIEDERIRVEVAPGVVLQVHRAAIAKIVTPGPTTDEPPTATTETEQGREATDENPDPSDPLNKRGDT